MSPINIFIFLETLMVLAIGLLYTWRLQKQEKELKSRQKHAQQAAERMVEHAQKESQEILKHALHKAEELVDKTDMFQENIQAKLQSTLKERSENVSDSFDTVVKVLKEEYVKEIEDSFKKLEKDGEKHLAEFQILLKNEGLSHKSFFDQKLEEDYQTAKKEVEEYRRLKIEGINQLMSSKVNELSMQVLGKAIPMKDQERLIMEAIEKAEKEGML